MINGNRWDAAYGASMEKLAPVLEICHDIEGVYPNGDTLPGLWITEPFIAEDGRPIGRRYAVCYDPADDTDDGADALWYGGRYYEEAMGYLDAADHEKRVDCFRAAELLYRHAAGMGNAVANLCLGYVYSYDRCEGRYWGCERYQQKGREYPREERAFECLSLAAEAGIPEACYKLGDMHKHGTGCDPDSGEAFRWYVRASELAVRERPVILGSIALRLGECYEEGIGCTQDFARALAWYQRADEGLAAAVAGGEEWYAKALAVARAGVKRCQQEV